MVFPFRPETLVLTRTPKFNGFDVTTGALGQGGLEFGRQATVGLTYAAGASYSIGKLLLFGNVTDVRLSSGTRVRATTIETGVTYLMHVMLCARIRVCVFTGTV